MVTPSISRTRRKETDNQSINQSLKPAGFQYLKYVKVILLIYYHFFLEKSISSFGECFVLDFVIIGSVVHLKEIFKVANVFSLFPYYNPFDFFII